MKAICWQGKKDLRCEEVPDPIIEDPKDAIVRLYPTGEFRTDVAGGTGIHFILPEADRMPSWLAVAGVRASPTAPTRRPPDDSPNRFSRRCPVSRTTSSVATSRFATPSAMFEFPLPGEDRP